MMRSAIASVLMLLLWSLAPAQVRAIEADQRPLEPFEAIQLAAADPSKGVTGVFELTILGSGKDRTYVYLNSEKDYRDQRCLTLRMTRGNAVALVEVLGLEDRDGIIGKRLRVEGTAKRQRIDFRSNGRRTGSYYYQTHVYVDDLSKVRLVGADG